MQIFIVQHIDPCFRMYFKGPFYWLFFIDGNLTNKKYQDLI